MKLLLSLSVGLLACSHAQVVPHTTATPTHFRWSAVQAHELDYNRTIRKSHDLSQAAKDQLEKAVVLQLRRDDDLVDDLTEKQVQDLAGETRIELVDLNGDDKPEIIAQANGLGPCGGTGNCIFWIFERTGDGLKLLLSTNDRSQITFEKILIRPWSTNGYRDIVLGSHSNASSRNLVWFQFSNGEYRIHACYYSTWMGDDGQVLNAPAIWPEKCSRSLGPLR
jgi:hypothetical protein